MAEKRMFSLSVIDTDWFLDLPLSTQALYFHLSMRADDDGFVDSPKSILRKINASQNDYDMLLAKRYILEFESGIIVIKHWRMHNSIQKDRYKPTQFQEELNSLELKDNKAYTEKGVCIQSVYNLDTKCIPSNNTKPNTKSLNKEELREYREGKETSKRFVPPTIEEVRQYCLERKNNIDPEQFVDFYESKGWKVGNTPMKNWKACIITWEKKDKQKVTQTKYFKNNPPLDENGNIDLTCGGTFRGTIL